MVGEQLSESLSEFLREKYYAELLKAVKEDKAVIVDFEAFDRHDPITADMLLEDPDLVIKSFDEAASSVAEEKARVRIRNLPESRQIRIRNLRAKHLNKFMQIDATIKSATEVRPQIQSATFQCPDCSANIKVAQDSNLLTKPIMCECGRRGDFPLVSKELMDTRWLTGIEPFEVTTGEQPGEIPIFLKEDLTTPRMQKKTDPGSSLRITGVLKELPRRIKGKASTKMDIYVEANHIETREIEFEDLDISPEDEKQIKALAADNEIYEKLRASIAPGIYGFDEIKEAVALQLFGGIAHHMPDGSRIRGNLHILLCGDPGCLVGDERVVLGNGSIIKIQDLGKEHLQPINAQVLTGEGGAKRDRAKVFHSYKKQPVMEIITETGKSIKGTHNHPLQCISGDFGRVVRKWKRLDEIKTGDKVCVITGIPCTITALIETNFKSVPRKYGPKFKGKLPKCVTEELAAFMGYVLGDGWVRERKSEIGFVVAESEIDILDKLVDMSKSLFSISPTFKKYLPKPGYIGERLIKRKMTLTYGYLYSQDIAANFDFVKAKRVPDLILKSGNKVAASFLRWLYEADGSVFDKGRGNRSINLKSKNIELLRDVQILLLRFSIHSRILGDDNLMIRRGESMLKFSEHIGFVSKKKTQKLEQLAKSAEEFKHFKSQRTERIVKIIKHGPEDVYDIEVPKTHRFIANGIISHNTGKTQMLKLVSTVVPRGRYVSGSGVTGAGMTASVRKDEIIGTWVLEAGALILANKSVIGIDEFDKISKDDQIALHEAMSVESYHGNTKLTLSSGEARPIREIVDEIFLKYTNQVKKGNECFFVEPDAKDSPELFVTDLNKISVAKAFRASMHKAPEYFIKIILENGRSVTVTPNHPFLLLQGLEFDEIPAEKLHSGMWVPMPRIMPIDGSEVKIETKGRKHPLAKPILFPAENSPQFCEWLGYIISEGSHEINRGRINGMNFTNSDSALLERFTGLTNSLTGLKPYLHAKEGRTMLRYISSDLAARLQTLNASILENSWKKEIPSFVFRSKKEHIARLISAMFDGDGSLWMHKEGGLYIVYTTASKKLSEELADLLLRFGIVAQVRTTKNPSKRSKRPIYRVYITGASNQRAFLAHIGFLSKEKNNKIRNYLKNKHLRGGFSEKLPIGPDIVRLLKIMKIPQKSALNYTFTEHASGKFNFTRNNAQKILKKLEHRIRDISETLEHLNKFSSAELRRVRQKFNISCEEIGKIVGRTHQDISYWERKGFPKGMFELYRSALQTRLIKFHNLNNDIQKLKRLVEGDILVCRIKDVEKIPNKGEEWVYDISVPGQLFLSEGMILHNTVSIAKASIVATLPAQTAVLAGANPQYGRFDTYKTIIEQIQIPETLLSRFDLKFAIIDKPDKTTDERLADHIIMSRTDPQKVIPVIDLHLLRKYIAYAKQGVKDLVLTDEAAQTLKQFYIGMRSPGGEGGPVGITLRQYEALLRMAEASAKIRLDTHVRKEDADRAIKLMHFSLRQLGFDLETGKIDIDKLESGVTTSKRKRINIVLEIIEKLQQSAREVAEADIFAEAETQGMSQKDAEETLDRLRKDGTIFEPRAGVYRKT